MPVELIVTEHFRHEGKRYEVGALIRDAAEMDWAQQHYPSHVMRKSYTDYPVAARAADEPGRPASERE